MDRNVKGRFAVFKLMILGGIYFVVSARGEPEMG